MSDAFREAYRKAAQFLLEKGIEVVHIPKSEAPQWAGGLYVAIAPAGSTLPTFVEAGRNCIMRHSYRSDCTIGAWRVVTGSTWNAWPT